MHLVKTEISKVDKVFPLLSLAIFHYFIWTFFLCTFICMTFDPILHGLIHFPSEPDHMIAVIAVSGGSSINDISWVHDSYFYLQETKHKGWPLETHQFDNFV